MYCFGCAGSSLLSTGFSLVETIGGYSLVVVASLCGARALEHAVSNVVAHRRSCFEVCGIFPDQKSNWCPCIGRRIPNHWTTGKALVLHSYSTFLPYVSRNKLQIRPNHVRRGDQYTNTPVLP